MSASRPATDSSHTRRVLVIAYYFPPMGLSGVQRVARFVKYLPRYGWLPTVLTVKPAGYFAYDQTLLEELQSVPGVTIRRTRSVDPTRLFGRRVVSLPREPRRRAISELSQWFFLPDNKIGWLPFAVHEGARILRGRRFHAIMSSAPPYTSHLIGAALSRRFEIPLILDFRDDWLDNPRHVYPTRGHRKMHVLLEKWAVAAADDVVTINDVIAAAIMQRHHRDVGVIEHGFDADDFAQTLAPDPATFTVTYTGIFYDAQSPDTFLRGCAQFLNRCPDARGRLKVVFAGSLPERSRELADALGVAVDFRGYLPHAAVVDLQQRSDLLWMTIGKRPGAESISTGKLFEYIGARRPILALVPDGAAARILASHGEASVCDPDDVAQVAAALEDAFRRWARGEKGAPDEQFVQRFDRANLTFRLAQRLNQVSSQTPADFNA